MKTNQKDFMLFFLGNDTVDQLSFSVSGKLIERKAWMFYTYNGTLNNGCSRVARSPGEQGYRI